MSTSETSILNLSDSPLGEKGSMANPDPPELNTPLEPNSSGGLTVSTDATTMKPPTESQDLTPPANPSPEGLPAAIPPIVEPQQGTSRGVNGSEQGQHVPSIAQQAPPPGASGHPPCPPLRHFQHQIAGHPGMQQQLCYRAPNGHVYVMPNADPRARYVGVPGAPHMVHPQHVQQLQQVVQQSHPGMRPPGAPGEAHARPPHIIQVPHHGQPGHHPQFHGQRPGPPPGYIDPRQQRHPMAPPQFHQHPQGHPLQHRQYVPIAPGHAHPEDQAQRSSLPGTPAPAPTHAVQRPSTVPANMMVPGQGAERILNPTTSDPNGHPEHDTALRKRRRRTENEHERPASGMEERPVVPNSYSRHTPEIGLTSPPTKNAASIFKNPVPGMDLTDPKVLQSLTPTFVMEICQGQLKQYRDHLESEIMLLKSENGQQKTELADYKRLVERMNARQSEALTVKDNMIETLRRYNKEYGHATHFKDDQNANLHAMVKELEKEKLSTKGLIENLEGQRNHLQLKNQALTTEVNKLRSELWQIKNGNEPAENKRMQRAIDALNPNEAYRNLQICLTQKTNETEHYKKLFNDVNGRLKASEGELKEAKKKLENVKEEQKEGPKYDNLVDHLAKIRAELKTIAETRPDEHVKVIDVPPEEFLEKESRKEVFDWLEVIKKIKIGYVYSSQLIDNKKEIIDLFRDGWNDTLTIEREVYSRHNSEAVRKINHDKFVKLYTDTKKGYLKLASTSNTLSRKRRANEDNISGCIGKRTCVELSPEITPA